MIDPSHPHAKLPDKATLERLYVQKGLSMQQIAQKYGVQKKTVYNTMKRRAERAGTPWPLKMGRPGWRQRAGRKHGEVHWDSVPTLMLRAEIRECRETYKVTHKVIAKHAGLPKGTIDQVAAPKGVARVSRKTATKIMKGVVAVEGGAR